MTQGKIERWHQTPIDRILLENYHLAGDLGTQVEAFAAVYTHAARQLT
jgi:putative transposase